MTAVSLVNLLKFVIGLKNNINSEGDLFVTVEGDYSELTLY